MDGTLHYSSHGRTIELTHQDFNGHDDRPAIAVNLWEKHHGFTCGYLSIMFRTPEHIRALASELHLAADELEAAQKHAAQAKGRLHRSAPDELEAAQAMAGQAKEEQDARNELQFVPSVEDLAEAAGERIEYGERTEDAQAHRGFSEAAIDRADQLRAEAREAAVAESIEARR